MRLKNARRSQKVKALVQDAATNIAKSIHHGSTNWSVFYSGSSHLHLFDFIGETLREKEWI